MREQIRFDIQQYHRRIKLAVYFQHKKDSECPPFTPKSQWVPPNGKLPPEITALSNADLQHLQNKFHIWRVKPNLSTHEFEALNLLCKNSNIIIKPAVKGSAVVILDKDQYLWEGYRQLNN